MSQSASGNAGYLGNGVANVDTRDELQFNVNTWQQFAGDEQANKAYRVNSSLPADSWNELDDTVYQTMENTLTIVSDLRGAGLTSTADIQSKTVEWNVIDDAGEASVDMDVETAVTESTVSYGVQGVPLPIVHDDFSLGFRDRPAPNSPTNVGQPLDTLGASVASRHVAEKLEDLTLNGWEPSINAGNNQYTLYGLTNHPDITTGALSDWNLAPTNIRTDIRAMIQDIKVTNEFRPGNTGYWLYIASNLEDALNDADPEGSGDMEVRDRVANLSDVGRLETADYLPDNSALMFRPTQDVVDMAIAEDFQTVEWSSNAGFREYLKVMAAMVPRVKSTKTGQSGIAYYTLP